MMSAMIRRLFPIPLALSILLLTGSLRAATGKGAEWTPNFDRALADARRQDRVILAYFSGSDWDPWSQKLEKDVLDTPFFRQWAMDHVVLLKIDFPRNRQLSSTTRAQNQKLKTQYNIAKVPTFVFLDPFGQPFARAGYDDLRLRDEEHTGEPKAAIAFLEGVLKTR